MRRIESFYPILLIILLPIWFNIAIGGGGSTDNSSSTSIGSYKTVKISASPEYSAKYNKPSKGDPVEMAYEFFELNQERLGVKNPRAELLHTYKAMDNIGGVVTFQQVYGGVPILYSQIAARFTGTGELKSVEGEYHYDINLSTTPSIDSATVENLALKDLGFPKDAKVVNNKKRKASTQLCIWLHQDGKFHLIWVVWVSQDYPEAHAWQYYIDAHDGTVLKKADRMMRN